MIPRFDSEAWFLKALGSLWGGWGAIRWSFWWGLESEFHSTDCLLRSFNKDLLHETGWRKLKKNPRNPPLCSVLPDFDVFRYPEISWSPGFGESSRGRNWNYILTYCSHEMSWTQSNTELHSTDSKAGKEIVPGFGKGRRRRKWWKWWKWRWRGGRGGRRRQGLTRSWSDAMGSLQEIGASLVFCK